MWQQYHLALAAWRERMIRTELEVGSGKWEVGTPRRPGICKVLSRIRPTLTKLTTTVSRKSTALSKKVQCTV